MSDEPGLDKQAANMAGRTGLTPPEGYERMPEGLGFGDHLQPFYRRIDAEDVSFALRVDRQHLNLMGVCHGGAMMTLADIAAASSIRVAGGRQAAIPTINLSFDFVSPGKPGAWLITRSDHVRVKRRFGFCSGAIWDEDTLVCRYSGTFYFPDAPPAGMDRDARERLDRLVGEGSS